MPALHILDLNYLGQPESIAAHLVIGPEGPVLVETGPASTVDALVAGLSAHGVQPRDVRDVLVTHIHFDHAGAAGWMARHGATVHVHEFGAPHLANPERLVASARRIYKERFDAMWGDVIPIPGAQVHAVRDGEIVRAGGLDFRAIETPGHARHHHAFALELDGRRLAFTGDAAACFVHEAPTFLSLPTPPPEFDQAQWLATIDRLEAERFDRLHPTHFGSCDDPAAHLARVREALHAHVDLVRAALAEGLDRPAILARYQRWFLDQAERHGVPASKHVFYAKDSLVDMNLTGMMRWMEKSGSGNASM